MTAAASALRVPWAFFRRDRLIQTSYKAGFVMQLGGATLTVATFFFVSRVFSTATGIGVDAYGGSYFGFVLVGIVLTEYINQGIGALGGALRESQTTGTLELMLLSPTRLPVVLFSMTLWTYASATVSAFTYFAVRAALGTDLSRANLPLAALTLALALLSFTGLGLMAGALVILIKRGNPLGWLIRGGSVLLGGVFYPTSVLPAGLQLVGQVLPMTHALDVLRRVVLLGQGLDQVGGGLVALVVLSAVYVPLGLVACAGAIRVARTDGSLSHY